MAALSSIAPARLEDGGDPRLRRLVRHPQGSAAECLAGQQRDHEENQEREQRSAQPDQDRRRGVWRGERVRRYGGNARQQRGQGTDGWNRHHQRRW